MDLRTLQELIFLGQCTWQEKYTNLAQLRWEASIQSNKSCSFIHVLIYKKSQLPRLWQDVTMATSQQRCWDLCGLRLYKYNIENLLNELIFSRKKYGSVRRVFIVSEKDEVGKKDFQQWMIDKNPPDKVEKIRGSDHMVMISDKPLELCFLLSRNIAGKYSWSQFTIRGKRIFCVKITWLNVTVK